MEHPSNSETSEFRFYANIARYCQLIREHMFNIISGIAFKLFNMLMNFNCHMLSIY